jgi:hypothetical protein
MEQDKSLNINQMLIILSGFTFIIIISSILTFSFPVFILQLILGLITLLFCIKTDYKTALMWLSIFGISMIFIFIIYLANKFYYGVPYYNGGSDDLKFEQWGLDVYNSGYYDPSKIIKYEILGQYHNSPFFPSYIAMLIQFSKLIGGYTTFLPRVANVYFLIWICMILKYFLSKYTNLSNKTIFYSIVFFAFMPNIQYINSHIFRDTFNLLQVLLIVLLVDVLLTNNNYILKIIDIILLPFMIYTAYYTRISSILFAGVLILLMIIDIYKIKKRYVFIVIIPIILLSDLLEIFRFSYFIKTYSSYVSDIAGDGLSKFIFNQPLFPLGIIFRSFYAFITPFPNFFELFKDTSKILFDIVQLFIYLGVLTQILAIPFIIKRSLKLDLLSLVFLGWFMAVIITTFTFRHVLLYYPFMAAIAVDGYINTEPYNQKIMTFISILITISFGIIYISLKQFL